MVSIRRAFSPALALRPTGARILLALLLLAVVAVSAPGGLEAQVPATIAVSDTLQEIRLTDGSTLFGRIVAVEEEQLTIETVAGVRVPIPRAQIRSLRAVEGRVVDGEFWPEDPNRTRLLIISPTGRALRAGEGYISSFWIFLPFVAYGVTDNITIAGGTPLLPGVIGRIIYIAPKVRVLDLDRLDLSVGALAGFATERIDIGSAGLLYGVGTFGETDQSLTAGAGWGFAIGGGEAEISNQPLLMFGGEYRVARRLKLLSENFVLPGESLGFLSGGIRFFGERLSADLGVGFVVGVGEADGIPWVPLLNFVYNFGGRR